MSTALPSIDTTWLNVLADCFEQPYMQKLREFLCYEREQGQIFYPPNKQVFRAFNETPLDQVKVIILGQDPYHGEGQAHGLAFSVNKDIRIPPSLVNIYKEIQSDLGEENFTIPSHGDLSKWAKQGVLLLNTVLTVRASQAHSHRNKGWEQFTDHVIEVLNQQDDPKIFVLWGSPAKVKSKLINTKKHIILTAAHPSPLSAYRGFFGCRHFSQINECLLKLGKEPIDWQV